MIYLSLSYNKRYLAWSLFDGQKLERVDKFYFNDFQQYHQMNELHNYLAGLIEHYKVGIVVVKQIDVKDYKKEEIAYVYKVRGIIEAICGMLRLIYIEARTNGWEYYILNGKVTNKRKLKIVNDGYGTFFSQDKSNFILDDVEIANAVILGEAMAHRRLHV